MFKQFKKKMYKMLRQKEFNNQPLGTEDIVNISDIIIPPEYKKTQPNKLKMDTFNTLYGVFGYLDKPITVQAELNEYGNPNRLLLTNGYGRYLVAKNNKLSKVPVKYIIAVGWYRTYKNNRKDNKIWKQR